MTVETLTQPHRHLLEVRKSRFLAQAAPIERPEAALDFIAAVGDAAATHNCWAYRLGQAYRFSDDGEPGGTAGRPILQAIESQGLDQVVVVVTRWYGGIKLGTGGLARAYGGSAAECLRLAPRQVLRPMSAWTIHCEFAELALIRARLGELGAEFGVESYAADGVRLAFKLPDAQRAQAAIRLRDLSRGRIELDSPEKH